LGGGKRGLNPRRLFQGRRAQAFAGIGKGFANHVWQRKIYHENQCIKPLALTMP
jgi:hypothetical protein